MKIEDVSANTLFSALETEVEKAEILPQGLANYLDYKAPCRIGTLYVVFITSPDDVTVVEVNGGFLDDGEEFVAEEVSHLPDCHWASVEYLRITPHQWLGWVNNNNFSEYEYLSSKADEDGMLNLHIYWE